MKIIISILLSICLISCDTKNKRATTIAKIDYRSSGCFGGETCKFILVNSNGVMIAYLTSLNTTHTILLDSNKLQLCNKFISDLKTIDFGIGCTTVAYYSGKIGTEKFEVTDGGCSWDGFDRLRRTLLGEDFRSL